MDKIRCIAIDDEPFALEIIKEDICKIDFLELVGSFYHAESAVSVITSGNADLIFLDIQMPGMTGIKFLRTLDVIPMVIITTAFEEFAMDGFELDVVDYLLKPIPFPRFCQAVQRAKNLYYFNQQNTVRANAEYLYVFSGYHKIKIPQNDILYIEGMKDYVKIFTTDRSKPVLTRMNLKKWNLNWHPESFAGFTIPSSFR